jgi:hypothetical protein
MIKEERSNSKLFDRTIGRLGANTVQEFPAINKQEEERK